MQIIHRKLTYVKKHFDFVVEHKGREYTGWYVLEMGPDGEVYDESVFFEDESDSEVDYEELEDYVLEHIAS